MSSAEKQDKRKVFVSYSWTSKIHEEWMIHLAKQLCENGVDVILDKWSLREGQDKNKFMEQMVTDPEVEKVLVICDRHYAEKADARVGGVGTESQIISAEVYAKVDQTKFIPVLAEVDEKGNPFLPTFMKTRIYVDLSTQEKLNENLDQLLRAIFDRPLHQKPEVGEPPQRIFEEAKVYTTTARQARAVIDAVKAAAPQVVPLLQDYFAAVLGTMAEFRIGPDEAVNPLDEVVVKKIQDFLPIRDEIVSVLDCVFQYRDDQELLAVVHGFYESMLPFRFQPADASQWNDLWADQFDFITYELFLYLIAILFKHRRWSAASHFFSEPYYLTIPNQPSVHVHFDVFYPQPESLEVSRKQRLKLKRISITADILKDRATGKVVSFGQIMFAELVVLLRCLVDPAGQRRWYPRSLVYAEHSGSFELFARARHQRWFAHVKVLLGVKDKDDFRERLNAGFKRLRVSEWHAFWGPERQIREWVDLDQLDTIS